MSDIELKPCPFCGSEAVIVRSWAYKFYSVSCNNEKDCMGDNMEQDEQGGFACEYTSPSQAAKAWNTRLGEQQ